LTDEERRLVEKWLRADGEKETHIRVVAARARKFMPQIELDLALLKQLLKTYDRNKIKR